MLEQQKQTSLGTDMMTCFTHTHKTGLGMSFLSFTLYSNEVSIYLSIYLSLITFVVAKVKEKKEQEQEEKRTE